ncbi:MAG TPA: PAS domain S-box protein, partial [Chitinophagaceae bacterium]|nr:PAS domain S-box protein [Chitinophagaceae bacterium]
MPDITSQSSLKRWAGYLTATVFFISLLALTGWQFDIPWMRRPLTLLPSMNPATAVAFLLAAISFYGIDDKGTPSRNKFPWISCAVLVCTIGILKVIHSFSDLNIPVDTLLYHRALETDRPGHAPNRMAPNTAICLFFIGSSLLALHIRSIRRFVPVQLISLIISLIALLGLLGYFYKVTAFYGVLTYIPMAAHTAFCFLLFSLSIFFIEPRGILMREFTTIYTGSSTARLLIPAAIIIPIILGLARLYGHWNGALTIEFGVAILVLSIIIAFLILIWFNAYSLNRKDQLRVQAEQQISQLGHLVEQTSDAVFSTDSDLVIKSWNKAAEKMYGYPPAQAVGQTVNNLLKIKQGAEANEQSMNRLQQFGYYQGEFQATQRSGEIVYIHASVSALKNEQGIITGYVGVHTDITERKKKERLQEQFNEELSRQVEEKTILIKNILERVSDGFYSLDENWRFTYINTYAAAIMGYEPEDLIGKHLWSGFPGAKDNPLYSVFIKTYEEQKQAQLEIYYEPFRKWFMVHVYPSSTGISVFFRDISDIRKAEAEMKRTGERFDLISRTTNDAIWEWNLETGEMWGNETHQRLYGLTMGDPVPDEKEWKERLHPEERDALVKKQETTLASDSNVFITEYRFRTNENGYRNIYDRCYIVRNEEGKAVRILGSMMDITERKQAEEKLKRRESQLLASIENTPNVAVQWYNNKGEVMFWNHASELIFGWGTTEVIGKTLDQLIHTKEQAHEFLRILDHIGQTGKTIGPSEFSFHRKDSSVGYCMATIFSIPSIDGAPCYVCMDVDITESKKAEQTMRESEERYRALVENAVEALVVLDMEKGKFVSVSESAVQLFKMSREELLKIGPLDVSPGFQPDGRPSAESAMEKIQRAIAGEKPSFEWTHCDARGEPISCEVRLVRLPADKQVLVRGSIIDITERKKAEQAIITSEETRRLIMNSALDAIVCIDNSGRIIVWTPQAEKTFGWSSDEAMGKTLTETIIPSQYREAHDSGFKKFLQTGEGRMLNKLIEISAIHKNGNEFPIELAITPVSQGRSEFCCAFIRDITKRKEGEMALKRSEEKLRHILSSTTDDFYVIDKDYRVVLINASAQENLALFWGKPVNPGTYIPDVVPVKMKEIIISNYNRVFEGEMIEYEFMNHLGEEVVWRRINYGPVRDEHGEITGAHITTKDITERKKAEEEIVKTNARFQIMTKATSDIIWDWNLKDDSMWWNDNYYFNFGYKKHKEIVAIQDWYEHIHPEDLQRVRTTIMGFIRGTETVWRDEYRYRRSDGTYLYILDRGYIMRDSNNNPYRMIGSMVDMTPIYNVQKKVAESENRLRTILDTDPECIKLLDKEFKVLDINKAGLRMIEAAENDILVGHSILSVVSDQYRSTTEQLMRDAFQGIAGRLEFEMITLKGNPRWCEVSMVPFRNGEGEIVSVLGVTRDITDKKNVMNELVRNEEKYRTLVEQAIDAIALYDVSGRILDVNTGSVNLLKY